MEPPTQTKSARCSSYAKIEQIPADAYYVPVALAQRRLPYRAGIALSARQRSVYRSAMAMSREKGPCCCRCWPWSAFEGLSRYLIVRRDWGAARLSRLIDALDGCGADPQHSSPGRRRPYYAV